MSALGNKLQAEPSFVFGSPVQTQTVVGFKRNWSQVEAGRKVTKASVQIGVQTANEKRPDSFPGCTAEHRKSHLWGLRITSGFCLVHSVRTVDTFTLMSQDKTPNPTFCPACQLPALNQPIFHSFIGSDQCHWNLSYVVMPSGSTDKRKMKHSLKPVPAPTEQSHSCHGRNRSLLQTWVGKELLIF